MTDTPDDLRAGPERDAPQSEVAPVTAPLGGMLPSRKRRRFSIERGLMRVVPTCGIVGIATVVAPILGSQDVAEWIIGLVASGISVILAAPCGHVAAFVFGAADERCTSRGETTPRPRAALV